MAPTITADQFLAAAKHRRTVYGLKSTSAVSDERVKQIVGEVLSFAPSSYNTQPGRITIVTGEKHKGLWEAITKEAEPILKGAGEEVWKTMSGIFAAHKGAYGSVVFWDSGDAIKEAGTKHQSAAHMFPQFADHSTGMAQILVWTALELEGLGANLQHLQAIPPVEAVIKSYLGVPADYTLKAHLNYGDLAQPHPEAVPEKLPLSETLKVVS
ncbi:Nitroreductase-like protein [Trichoderma afarasin]|uniref:Nitroreductase HBN1 n=1 Tax=Trichoderma lentiforme TaxID=1567552 RepID=A0A9P5C6J5_9HYPO|nr:putative nitroreductase HBN1 [Trichoderma lentiforme]